MIVTAYNPRMIGLGTVAPAMSTTVRWGVVGWEFVTQPAAIKTYRWVGAMTVALAQLAFWSAVWVMAQVKDWVDSEVAAALPVAQPVAKPTLAQLRKRCIDHNKALPKGDPRRIARAARLTKAEALEALAGV